VPVFDMADRPISGLELVFKWLFDKIVAITALILLSPVMVGTAIAIKLDSKDRCFFKQKRHGFNNELIDVYKFRSMRTVMSTSTRPKLVNQGRSARSPRSASSSAAPRSRLPQLFNVLKVVVDRRAAPHALQAKADNKLYYGQ